MTYDEIAAVFLTPPSEPFPAPEWELPATSARRLRDALEPIATQGWWSRPAGDQMNALGLSFIEGYVGGRAAALGNDPSPGVAIAAFGVFEPAMLRSACAAAAASVPRDRLLAARAAGASEALDSLVSETEAEEIAAPLLGVLAGLDGLARPLFGALRELPLPTTPGGRLWRAAELVREHRGDGHLAALATADLDAVEANVLTELWLGFGLGEYSGTRAFSADHVAAAVGRLAARGWVDAGPASAETGATGAAEVALTEEGLLARSEIEAATDRSQDRLVAALGNHLDTLVARASAISDRILAAGWFPLDPRKRNGG